MGSIVMEVEVGSIRSAEPGREGRKLFDSPILILVLRGPRVYAYTRGNLSERPNQGIEKRIFGVSGNFRTTDPVPAIRRGGEQ